MARLSPNVYAGIEFVANKEIMGMNMQSYGSAFNVGANLEGIASRLTLKDDGYDTNPGLNQ